MLKRGLLLLGVLMLLFSCTDDDDKSENQIAREKWNSLQIKDYSIKERRACFCAGLLEWTVEVEDNIKDTVFFDESKLYQGQTYKMVFDDAKTIEDVFDFIENFDTNKADELVVVYNEEYGFPKSISIDYIKEAVDDEITYLYNDFTINP